MLNTQYSKYLIYVFLLLHNAPQNSGVCMLISLIQKMIRKIISCTSYSKVRRICSTKLLSRSGYPDFRGKAKNRTTH